MKIPGVLVKPRCYYCNKLNSYRKLHYHSVWNNVLDPNEYYWLISNPCEQCCSENVKVVTSHKWIRINNNTYVHEILHVMLQVNITGSYYKIYWSPSSKECTIYSLAPTGRPMVDIGKFKKNKLTPENVEKKLKTILPLL